MDDPELVLDGLRGLGDHRRGAAPSRPVPDSSRARGSPPEAGAIPGARQRIARPPPAVVGIARGPHQLLSAGRLRSRRGRPRPPQSPLAAWWISGSVARPHESERLSVARELRADVPRARSSGAGHSRSGTRPAAFLDHAGPLARSGLELVRVRALVRGRGYHRAPVSRHPDECSRCPPASALAREHRQAAGQGSQGLPARCRGAACPAGHRRHAVIEHSHPKSGASWEGFLLEASHRPAPPRRRARPLLGRPYGRGARL